MKLMFALLSSVMVTGCIGVYKPPPPSEKTAELSFELLTESGAGGGALHLGSAVECKIDGNVSGFRKGHLFLSDKDKLSTRISANRPITVQATVANTSEYWCESTFVFIPKEHASYFVTFEYFREGCLLKISEISSAGRLLPVEIKVCE